MNFKWFIFWLAVAFGIAIALGLLFPPVSAAPYVYQGENVTQGETYDLSGVYSWGDYQGEFAYWKNWYNEGTRVEPTRIIYVEPRNVYSVYIDPNQWTAGNWYKRCTDCKNENNFAFKVIGAADAVPRATLVEPNTTIVAVTGRQTTVPPTVVTTATPAPTPANTPIVIVVTTVPTPVPTPTFPKPGLPLSPFPVMLGILGAALLFLKFRGM